MSDASPAAALTLQSLGKEFNGHPAVREVSLEVAPGEMIVLLGPSGCGKTTTLRMIAGFLPPTEGDILLDGHSLVDVPAYDRDIGIVFQSYALFPHLTVARNIRFGLEMRHIATAQANARVDEMLRLVKLESFAERLPRHLSGGQQQRVALARALAIHPRLLLLDEPLSNLDAALRQEMAREIRILQRDRGVTAIVVTHDQSEAMAMADRLVVMRDGGVEQIGRQEDLYERPATPFVAGFIGQSNLLRGRLGNDGFVLADGGGRIALAGRYQATGPACLAIRPESIHLDDPGATDARVQATIRLATYLGAVVEYVVRLDSGPDIILRGPTTGRDAERRRAAGERVSVMWGLAEELLFDQYERPAVAAPEQPEKN
jgi:putative spermidine/putrescine transport system ATP-binding protein